MHAKVQSKLLESSHRKVVLGREFDSAVTESLQILDNQLDTLNILRILFIVQLVASTESLVSAPVDLIWILDERLQSTKNEAFSQTLRVEGQVRNGAESTETLADSAPLLLLCRVVCSECLPDGLTVSNNVIRTVEFQIISLHGIVAPQAERGRRHGRAETGSSLVQIQHLVTPV